MPCIITSLSPTLSGINHENSLSFIYFRFAAKNRSFLNILPNHESNTKDEESRKNPKKRQSLNVLLCHQSETKTVKSYEQSFSLHSSFDMIKKMKKKQTNIASFTYEQSNFESDHKEKWQTLYLSLSGCWNSNPVKFDAKCW